MAMTKQELKEKAIKAIDDNKEKIFSIGDSIFLEPELGYKEHKTAEKVKRVFDELGISYTDGVAITGVIAPLKGKESKIKLSIMGELDAVVSPTHPHANPETHAAHACGHNAMIASLIGVAYALHTTGIMKELSGDVVLMAVPAEEFVELEYRQQLKDDGKIHFFGGKQEFIKLGHFDDIDLMIMQHTEGIREDGKKAVASHESNGFVGKLIRYHGKEAHAGGAPHKGVNALSAANIGLMAVDAQRATFRDEDRIRVHPIITKGGDLVNIIPSDVRLETYIRGATTNAIMNADEKVTRAFEAGGYAMGAITEIIDIPGYLPVRPDVKLTKVMYENMEVLFGKDKAIFQAEPMAGSTDAGDVSHIIPTIHSRFAGSIGDGHSFDYEIKDKDVAYLDAAKALAMTAIDLLVDEARVGIEIVNEFEPIMTKEEYLTTWGKL